MKLFREFQLQEGDSYEEFPNLQITFDESGKVVIVAGYSEVDTEEISQEIAKKVIEIMTLNHSLATAWYGIKPGIRLDIFGGLEKNIERILKGEEDEPI